MSKGLGPAVLSYKWQCVECFDKRYGWLVYITATLFPATILCLLVMVFQLHVTSAEMNAFVFLCQFITCTTTLLSPYTYAFRWLITIPFPVIISLLLSLFRPYKNNYFNIIDCLAFALLALSTFLIMYTCTTHTQFCIQLLYVILLTPFLYFVSFILYKILSQVALFHSCCSRIKKTLLARNENRYQHIQRGDNEDLPDRIVNPDMYQPLLPATNSSSGGKGDSQSECQPQVVVNSLVPYGSM